MGARWYGFSPVKIERDSGIRFADMFTLQRWTSSPPRRDVMLRRVEVAESMSAGRTLTLVSPTGMRIEAHDCGCGRDPASADVILGTSRAVSVFAYPAPVDLRKGYDVYCQPICNEPCLWARNAARILGYSGAQVVDGHILS